MARLTEILKCLFELELQTAYISVLHVMSNTVAYENSTAAKFQLYSDVPHTSVVQYINNI